MIFFLKKKLFDGMQQTQTTDVSQSTIQTRVQNPDKIVYVNMQEVWQNYTSTLVPNGQE